MTFIVFFINFSRLKTLPSYRLFFFAFYFYFGQTVFALAKVFAPYVLFDVVWSIANAGSSLFSVAWCWKVFIAKKDRT
jgi:hypothetical protein